MLLRFFLLSYLLLFCNFSYASCVYEGQPIQVPANIQLDCRELSDILDDVKNQVQAAQKFFRFIAAKDDNPERFIYKRDVVIPATLKLFANNATVQITNRYSKTAKEKRVSAYLNDLANLTRQYETISLEYDNDFKFSFKPKTDGTVEVDMVTWQGFEACVNKEKNCIDDITRKIFHVSGTLPITRGKIKIARITATVEETTSHQNFPNRQSNLVQKNKTNP